MNLPGIETYASGANAHAVTLTFPKGDTLKVWYSYSTPVAFAFNGARTVRENEWRQTTGRHLSAIDGGDKLAKRSRVSGEEFERKLGETLAKLADASPLAMLGAETLRQLAERGQLKGQGSPGNSRHILGMARDGFQALGEYARAHGFAMREGA